MLKRARMYYDICKFHICDSSTQDFILSSTADEF